MSLHSDLLLQARHLATREPKRPRQASLRRAVSAAYYALFHLLVGEATEFFLSGNRARLRPFLARAFSHAEMKNASGAVTEPQSKFAKLLSNGDTPQPELEKVAQAFVNLQQARYEADYDLKRSFTRQDVLDLVEMAETAFENWGKVRKTPQAQTYLLTLLEGKRLKV